MPPTTNNPQHASWTTSAGGGPFSATCAAYAPTAGYNRFLWAMTGGITDGYISSRAGTVTKGSVAFTLLYEFEQNNGAGTSWCTQLWFLKGFSDTAENIVASGGGWGVTGGSNRGGSLIVCTVLNANLIATFGTVASAGGISNTPSVNVTSAVGWLTVDNAVTRSSFTAIGAGQTQIDSIGSSFHVQGASWESGAAINTMSWTTAASDSWVTCGVGIKPAVSGRSRNLTYTYEIVSGKRVLRDANGWIVRPAQGRSDNWCAFLGFFPDTGEELGDFALEDNKFYFESVTYDGESDEVRFVTDRQQMSEIMLAQASMGSNM